MNIIIKWFMANYFIDAVKTIEKQNWMTSILKVCFKQKLVKENWNKFLEGMLRLVEDMRDEIQQAKGWEK